MSTSIKTDIQTLLRKHSPAVCTFICTVLESESEWLGEMHMLSYCVENGSEIFNPSWVNTVQDSPINQRPNSKKNIVYATLGQSWLYNLTLSRLLSRHQQMSHGQPCARVDFIPQLGTKDLASVYRCRAFVLYPCYTCVLKQRLAWPHCPNSEPHFSLYLRTNTTDAFLYRENSAQVFMLAGGKFMVSSSKQVGTGPWQESRTWHKIYIKFFKDKLFLVCLWQGYYILKINRVFLKR
jgi:hypothetical protein